MLKCWNGMTNRIFNIYPFQIIIESLSGLFFFGLFFKINNEEILYK